MLPPEAGQIGFSREQFTREIRTAWTCDAVARNALLECEEFWGLAEYSCRERARRIAIELSKLTYPGIPEEHVSALRSVAESAVGQHPLDPVMLAQYLCSLTALKSDGPAEAQRKAKSIEAQFAEHILRLRSARDFLAYSPSLAAMMDVVVQIVESERDRALSVFVPLEAFPRAAGRREIAAAAFRAIHSFIPPEYAQPGSPLHEQTIKAIASALGFDDYYSEDTYRNIGRRGW